MTNELPVNEVRNIWQKQPVEGTKMSMEEIWKGISKLQRVARRRKLIAGAICLFLMARFGWYFVVLPNLIQRIGAALIVIGTGYLGYQVLLAGKRQEGNGTAQTEPAVGLKFYRGELERQRDFHRGIWFWSRLVIFVPGPLVFYIGSALAHPERARIIHHNAVGFVMLVILAVPLNLWQARKYQRELDSLDAAEGGSQ